MSFQTIDYNNELGASSSMAQTTTSTSITNSNIFSNEHNSPLLFYIPFKDTQRKQYKDKIIQYGGIITENEPTINNNIVLLSSQPVPNKTSFKLEFIDDCIANGAIVDISNYRYHEYLITRNQRSIKQPKSHTKFTEAKDEYILEQVRRNPRKRNSHAFFDELADKEPLKEHSGNSIRSRYRAHLRDKLNYVYKTDADDQLIADSNGNLVRVSIDDFPFTLKNRFTADDDYLLCKEILKYNKEKKNTVLDPYADLTVPISFFGDFIRLKEAKGHTVNSWRDRYRKFICKYGVQNYIDYYEECLRENKIPEPITNKPNNDIRTQFKQLIGSSYQTTTPVQSKNKEVERALDEEIGEIKSSNIDNVLIEQDHRRTQVQQQKQLQMQSTEVAAVTAVRQHLLNTPEEEKRSKEGRENIEEPQSSDVDNSSSSEEQESQFDTQASQISIKYIDKPVKFEELLNENFFKFADPNKLLLKIFKVLNNKEEPGILNLFTKFKQLGFNENFTSHIIMSTNGDVLKIKNFIEYFLNRLYGSINTENCHEDELYTFLSIKNVNGIWDEESDRLLNTVEEHKLLKIHSESQIKTRKNFLKALNSA